MSFNSKTPVAVGFKMFNDETYEYYIERVPLEKLAEFHAAQFPRPWVQHVYFFARGWHRIQVVG